MNRILTATLVLSSVLAPAMAAASAPASDAASAQSVRVSTGVVAPTLLAPLSLYNSGLANVLPAPEEGSIKISLTVDQNGNAHDVKVTQSLNPYWDARVVTAVEHSHFQPASIDHQAIPLALDLVVGFSR